MMSTNLCRNAREANETELGDYMRDEELGRNVLTIAVLVILITAPIGAIAIMTAGGRLTP